MPPSRAASPTALTVTATTHILWLMTHTIALVILTLRGSCTYTARPARNEHICCGCCCVSCYGPFPVHHTYTHDPPRATFLVARDHGPESCSLHSTMATSTPSADALS